MTRPSSVMAFWAVALLLPLAASQAVGPSGGALPPIASPFNVTYSTSGTSGTAGVAPLTLETGIGQSTVALNTIRISGPLKLFNASTVAQTLGPGDIAYISCDPNTNSSDVSAAGLIELAGAHGSSAILLYSLVAAHCAIISPLNFGSIFSMTSADESKTLLDIFQTTSAHPTATIADVAMASLPNVTNEAQPSSDTPLATPTTAVAMSILYSITGIITLLFLIIIATGAVRAHRNPERYGPRAGFAGRPSQSRAKGLARAMLETLPIVKFGDPEPVKDGSRDVELQDGTGDDHSAAEAAEQPVESEEEPIPSATTDSGIGPNTHAPSKASDSNENAGDVDTLGCPICTEDFEKGQDVRVLPCNHKFHPACIDPWLLNVSGTCPLCRVNLARADGRPENAEGDALAPPLAAVHAPVDLGGSSSDREAQPLDATLLRQASAMERIAALRELRQQRDAGNAGGNRADDREEQRRSARVTRWLKEVFRVTTRRETNGQGETP